MKTLLVDDHALFREGMELVLKLLDASVVVLHAASVDEALRVLSREQVDFVLLDLHMPGMTGLDALLRMRARAEATPVVVLSGSENPQVVWSAIDAGAMGFIQKQMDSATMMVALRHVLAGGIYLPPVCLTEAGRRHAPPSPQLTPAERLRRAGLSNRQAQTLFMMAQGKPNKVIARELGIGEATVKTHVSAVFDALGVRNRTEAVYAIARLGLNLQEIGA